MARAALEEALDALALARGVERAERRLGRERVADHEPLRLLGEPGDDVVVDARAGEHARRGGAVLAGVVVAGAGDRLQRALEVDVVEDDHRRLAAELEVHALERRRRRCAAMRLPVSTEPVSETMSTSGCSTSACPAGSPWPVTTLSTPCGQDLGGELGEAHAS